MANTGTVVTIVAGGITFGNQWYQTHHANWKVPVATIILAAGVDGLAHIDKKGATLLSMLILMGAMTTRFNGRSVADTVTAMLNSRGQPPQKSKKVVKQ